jgi:3-deoxy-D-manno-octulosonic-acid transferase
MTNFAAIAALLLQAGGALQVADAPAIEACTARWLADPERAARAGLAARAVFAANRGALQRTLDLVDRSLAAAAPDANPRRPA